MKSTLTAVVAAATCAVIAFTPTVAATTPGPSADASRHLDILVLGNRADLVSGGDALVEVLLPPGADPSRLRMVLATDQGSRDVSEAFARRANDREANKKLLPAADFTQVPGAGHFIALEKPEMVADLLASVA